MQTLSKNQLSAHYGQRKEREKMKKVLPYILVLITMFMQLNLASAASNLEEGVKQLADQIGKSMQERQKQKVAIVDFSDLNGNVTALGQFMAEELTTQLFIIAPGKFEVVERRMLLKLVDELSLGQLGLIEEKSLKEMGRVLGVDAIVTGSLTDLGNTVKVNARVIAVESAKVVAVAAAEIQKTGVVADLLRKQAERRQVGIQVETQKTMLPSQQREEAQGFVFELQLCKASGKEVTCDLLITNKKENDRELKIFNSPGMLYRRSRMIDDLGNEYTANKIQLGNSISSSFSLASNILVSGVPTKAGLSFEDVSKVVSKIAILRIDFDYNTGKQFFVEFRNIPLSR